MERPRVLIVDSCADRHPFYRDLVGGLDAEPIFAAAAAAAHSSDAADGADGAAPFAAILLRLDAGDGGLPALNLLRRHQNTGSTPLVLIAASPALLQQLPLHEPGTVDCLADPVIPAVLRARLRLLLDLHLARAQLGRCEALLAAERQLRAQAEEISRLKDEFLADMSHELRTPLNSIFGWITLVRSGRLDPTTQERALEAIERGARAQKHLIEDLLDGSRIIAGKISVELRVVDPREVIATACASMLPAAQAKGLTLVHQAGQAGGCLRGDPARLQQVVCNLLSNAIKFTASGGRIEVLLEWRDGHAGITVCDSGQGIRPEFLPHVFGRFRQPDGSLSHRHGGVGVGLAMVHHLVQLHDGEVSAASDGEGRGSTFTVRIPAAKP